MDKYNKIYPIGRIYKMECWGCLPYYGSTCRSLKHRLRKHKNHHVKWKKSKHHFTSSFELIETGNPVSITLMEQHENINKRDLEKIEGCYIRNNHCVNVVIPTGITAETEKEYHKNYREQNKDKIRKQNKIYREQNREKIRKQKKIYRELNREKNKKYQKIYRELNREKLSKYQSEQTICSCGGHYTKNHKSRHLKTNMHKDYISSLKPKFKIKVKVKKL